MHLLQSGVDITVIALRLGHESPTTTHQYVEADLAMKEKALSRLQDPKVVARRFRADDSRWTSSRPCDYVQRMIAAALPLRR
jgi:integrase/recombinase XerD